VNPDDPDHGKLVGLMLDVETRVDAEMSDAPLIDRILAAQGDIRAELAKLQDDPAYPIDQIRIFDYEEDADDASVRVLTALGKNPIGVGQFFLDFMPADARAACLADVAAHRPIPYGRFIDTHPSSCWRYYHVNQFSSALSQCSAPATGVRTAKGSGRASVIDKAPREMVETGYGRELK
jgi:hypothetical protein